jgi:hypothetical protein
MMEGIPEKLSCQASDCAESFRYEGRTVGQIVVERTKATGREVQRLSEQARSRAFQTVGEMVQAFFKGEVRFVATGRAKVTGDPAQVLELCQKDGLSFHELKLKGKPLDEVLAACQELTADLSYLLLKGAIVAQPVTYVPPDFQGIASVVNVEELARKFPDFSDWVAVGRVHPGEGVMCPIVAVDVVVVVVDVVQVSYDRPIDLISRQ